jgi:hypothetical protein
MFVFVDVPASIRPLALHQLSACFILIGLTSQRIMACDISAKQPGDNFFMGDTALTFIDTRTDCIRVPRPRYLGSVLLIEERSQKLFINFKNYKKLGFFPENGTLMVNNQVSNNNVE